MPWIDKRTNADILNEAAGQQLSGTFIARKLDYIWHVVQKPGKTEKDLTTRTTRERRRRGRPARAWISDIMDWLEKTVEMLIHAVNDHTL